MLRKIYYLLPPALRLTARKIFYFPTDFIEGITGQRQKNAPKKGDIFIGSGDFILQGKKQVAHLQHYLQIQPTDHVLDIGCGIGRTAVPLQEIITEKGSYDGFDAMKQGIDWCNKNIHTASPHFNFKYIPLKNGLYNNTTGNAAELTFPYADRTFDKAFLFSVFTHMKVTEIENYLKEIYRVLKPGGSCLATFFTYSENDDLENNDGFKFPVLRKGYRLLDKNVEEANIAIEDNNLLTMIQNSGLHLVKKTDGFWKSKVKENRNINFQDIIILKKI